MRVICGSVSFSLHLTLLPSLVLSVSRPFHLSDRRAVELVATLFLHMHCCISRRRRKNPSVSSSTKKSSRNCRNNNKDNRRKDNNNSIGTPLPHHLLPQSPAATAERPLPFAHLLPLHPSLRRPQLLFLLALLLHPTSRHCSRIFCSTALMMTTRERITRGCHLSFHQGFNLCLFCVVADADSLLTLETEPLPFLLRHLRLRLPFSRHQRHPLLHLLLVEVLLLLIAVIFAGSAVNIIILFPVPPCILLLFLLPRPHPLILPRLVPLPPLCRLLPFQTLWLLLC